MGRYKVLITDLDNTLFDWVELWYRCFSAMLLSVAETSGIDLEQLKAEIRLVHQRHGTSEYSFLLEELPSLQRKYPNQSMVDIFSGAVAAFRIERRKHLHLYSTVAETLLKLKGAGVLLVGYTESMAFYSNYRVRRLGLDGVLDCVFSPADHDLPSGITPEQIRKYPAESYNFRFTIHKHTPSGRLKPDAGVLRAIITDDWGAGRRMRVCRR